MVYKQKINNKRLINFIIKNNLCFGDLHVNKDLEKYIWQLEDYHGTFLFNIYKQIKMLNKVRVVVNTVVLKKKPILFFGVNHFNFSKNDFYNIHLINREIFKMCFEPFDAGLKKHVNFLLGKFFDKVYSPIIGRGKKASSLVSFLGNYKKYMKFISHYLIKTKRIKPIGFFFSSWVRGYFSNYHFLRGQLKNNINKFLYLDQIGLDVDKSLFFNRYRNLKSISKIFDSNKNLPGVAIFFSRVGYDSFFLEFKKLGIPVICIVGNDDSLQNIEYPLIGDSLDLGTFLFYQKILQNFISRKVRRIYQ